MIKSLASGQKPALIVNEVQIGLLDRERAIFPALAEIAAERNIVANIAELIAAFRAKGHPVFYTPATNRPDMADKKINTMISAISAKLRNMVTGSPDIEHPPEIAPQPEDFVIQCGAGLIAFHGSSLDLTLRRMGVETVVLTGVSTASFPVTSHLYKYTSLAPTVVPLMRGHVEGQATLEPEKRC